MLSMDDSTPNASQVTRSDELHDVHQEPNGTEKHLRVAWISVVVQVTNTLKWLLKHERAGEGYQRQRQ